MNGEHQLSSDSEGQAAIRAAEQDRGPTLAHHEVPAMVEKLGAELVATASSLAKAYHEMAEALYRVNDRVARLEGWIDNRRADATSVAEAYAVAARQAEAAARDHTSTFVMPDPMRAAPQPPRGWLTPDERQVLTEVADEAEQSPSKEKWAHVASCVRALLARETPPKVQLPPEMAEVYDAVSVRNAIRAAGGEVTS